jgi:hypothetical protein
MLKNTPVNTSTGASTSDPDVFASTTVRTFPLKVNVADAARFPDETEKTIALEVWTNPRTPTAAARAVFELIRILFILFGLLN